MSTSVKVIHKTYQYKLKLTRLQAERVDSWINTCRCVYNLAKETKEYTYHSRGVNLSAYDLQKQITELRKEFDWISDVPSSCLGDVTERLDKSFKSFFKGAGFPKWARKDKYASITFKSLKFDNGIFRLPKIGDVFYYKDRHPEGKIRRATLTKKPGGYYLSVLVHQEVYNAVQKSEPIGLDMGISFFTSLSNGNQIENPRHLKKYLRKLRIEQRSLARKKKGSKSRDKQKERLAKVYLKVSNTRKDFLHKQSKILVDNFGLIAVEDLNVSSMVKNHNLAQHIFDAGWSTFFNMLEYKSGWYGSDFVKVNPRFTSQTCNECGSVNKKSRVSQSEFVCVECGIESNADKNAALNILSRGTAIIREREALA